MRKCSVRSAVLAGAALASFALVSKADIIYSDNFSTGTAGSALAGSAVQTATGLDGGTAGATYIGATTATGSGNSAIWVYGSAANTASVTSPAAPSEDTNLITNIFVPFVPQEGFIYDFELTMTVSASSGAHGGELGFLFNQRQRPYSRWQSGLVE